MQFLRMLVPLNKPDTNGLVQVHRIINPFSLYRLMLDHPPLNTVWKGKVMLVY